MKNGLVIADSGPIISLALIDELELRSIFKQFLKNKRFYSLQLLNKILEQAGEEKL